jgi:serine O-acetyltransferase
LYQHVTLGAKKLDGVPKGLPRHPIVEDDVVIYSGATVLGRITIGKGSVIGGGTWVTSDLPPGSFVTQARTQVESFADGAGI